MKIIFFSKSQISSHFQKIISRLIFFSAIFLISSVQTVSADSPLKLIVDNQTFFYNQEHTKIDVINEGFTITGNIAKIYLRYSFKKGLQVEVGALLDNPFGDDDRIDSADPIISIHYAFFPGWLITGGTIDRNHPLHDAFFNDNLRYLEPIEQGFQIKGNTKHILQDLWISWEERETPGRREKFSVGDVTRIKFNGFMLEGQLYWVHLGGQKNTGPGVFNNLSLGAGTGYTFHPYNVGGAGILDEIGFTVHYLYNSDDPPALPQVDDEGISARFFATLWDTYFYFLMWQGGSQTFNSPRGDITMPGIPLAKGDPFYKSNHFEEAGIVKTWELAEGVSLTFDFRGQFIVGEFVQIYALNFTWRESFPLFSDYFKNKKKKNLN